MKPLKFKEANIELNKPDSMTDAECNSLWVHRTTDGTCISLWSTSFWQRLLFLFHGKLWLGIVSGQTQPPVWLDSTPTVFQKPKKKTAAWKPLRSIELKLRYLLWALWRVKRIHIGDLVNYQGEVHQVINGVSAPTWKIMSISKDNLDKEQRETKEVHENKFLLLRGWRRDLQVIKQDYNFLMSNWYDIDMILPLFSKPKYPKF